MTTALKLLFFLIALAPFSGLRAQNENPIGHKDSVYTQGRNVFGTDDRKSTIYYTYDDYTRATAVMIYKSMFSGSYVQAPTLGDLLLDIYKPKGAKYIHSDVRFKDQPAAGDCSGFLIAPDILVTAGHCIDQSNMYDVEWVFDYTDKLNYPANKKIYIPDQNRYRVKEILTQKLIGRTDYAMLRLDRPVTGRKPFIFRTAGLISEGTNITLLGAPFGVPLKVVENAVVTQSNAAQTYFHTDLDAFGGNSGGPVFSSRSGLIEGILVRGPDNGYFSKGYYIDANCQCLRTKTYTEESAKTDGVEVQRIRDLPYDLLVGAIYTNINFALKSGNDDEVSRWAAYNWIHTYSSLKDSTPLVLRATELGRVGALKTLKQNSADLMVKDQNGRNIVYYALRSGEKDIYSFLQREGISFNETDNNGENAVFWAVSMYKTDALNMVLDQGVNMNLKNSFGNTPLHEAVYTYNLDMVQALTSHGADVLARDSDGKTPRKLAKKLKAKDIKKFLKKEEKRMKKGG
ncbi:MAG: ankyrin repeat domain-containing protein [Flavobacteriales bacterium]|nr:ankyrin repeat domain-containing protein [Flavobacteriales bacterium]